LPRTKESLDPATRIGRKRGERFQGALADNCCRFFSRIGGIETLF
jgi:hypothetical protein